MIKYSAAHGALRGSTHIMQSAMLKHGFTKNASDYTASTVYFFGYWFMHFMQHYQNDDISPRVATLADDSLMLKAAMAACYDILSLLFVCTISSALTQGFHYAAYRAECKGWTKTAQAFSFLSAHTPKLIYINSLREDGLLDTTLNLASGAATQQAVEYIGKQML